MKNNRLRELLNEGKPTWSAQVSTTWPGIVEVIGQSSVFDYISYMSDSSPFSLEHLDNLGRAIELFPNMSSMIKVEEQTRGFIAQRAIGAGIQNVLFADCRSAEDARECIRFVRSETPEAGGNHGLSGRRNTGYAYDPEAWVKAMDNVVIAILIEKKGAVENLEEILSVKGVDMVTFGPADYSISIGKVGQAQSPEVQKVHRDMIELALKKGVHPLVGLPSFEAAKPFWEMGVRHFATGTDLGIISERCQREGEAMRELLASV